MTNEMDGAIAIDKLRDHYKHCIRLSASNKINPKNAFDLQLIDYMQDLVSNAEDGQMNFKIASSALDVGAKIYSNRVDCIQSEAQKVASSILLALDGQAPRGDDQDETQLEANNSNVSERMNDSHDDDDQAKNSKKKRPSRSKNVKTIVDDVNILDAKIEKMVLGDPFLDGLSQDYDMSCPAALICYNSLTQPSCLLTIESSNLRKDYREVPDLSTKPPKVVQTPLAETNNQEHDSEQSSKTTEESSVDDDGDTIMEDDEPQKSSDKTDTNDFAHPGQIADATSNITKDGHLLVTLMTKYVNCAQIVRNNQNNHICPRLENFLFNDRTTGISGLISSLDETKLSIIAEKQQDPRLPTEARPLGFNPELYDGNAVDDCGDDHFADAESVTGNDANDKIEDLIPDLDRIAASKPTDYGYSNEHHRLLNTWAGPQNWKAVKLVQSTKKDAPRTARKRAKLEQKPIDFTEPIDAGLEKTADKDIRISSDVIRRWKKPLLPQDHNLDEDSIRTTMIHTFLRPEDTYHCTKTPADALKVVDADHDYIGTNRDDGVHTPTSPGGLGGFDDVHDDSDEEFRADPMIEGQEVAIYGAPLNDTMPQNAGLEFAGENLIEQPYTVAQVHIPFAKIAKKMDVRRLKRVMWDLLLPPEKRAELLMQLNGIASPDGNETITGSDLRNKTDASYMSGDANNETVIMVNGSATTESEKDKKNPSPTPSESAVHLEFSNLYGELPVRVSSKMASDLSQPIAFVTLLHLANEKNLKLIPKQDLKDFIIQQDELIV